MKNPWSHIRRGIKEGYRSGLEEDNAEWLRKLGVKFTYEELVINYWKPIKKYKMKHTFEDWITEPNKVISDWEPVTYHKYTPDFQILSNGIIIETKGRFLSKDRVKHLLIKAQHPSLDIRFCFSRSRAKLRTGGKSSYGDWCKRHGFKYCTKRILEEWTK